MMRNRVQPKNMISELWICIFIKKLNGLQIYLHGGEWAFFFLSINSKSYSQQWMEVSIIVYFVKCDQIKLEAGWILGVCMLVFQKWCPGFKPPSLKWAHHKTNTFWQQAGSLCSHEAQNLMSMNNEYYSTCWWLSRLPVIRSMKALFSREHSLSHWMTDSHHPRLLHTGNNFSNAAHQQMPADTLHQISAEFCPWCLLGHHGSNGMHRGLTLFTQMIVSFHVIRWINRSMPCQREWTFPLSAAEIAV